MGIDWETIFREAKETKHRKKPSDEEHRLQVACVRWFRLQYPQWSHALFSVPNGGRRDATTGAKLKAEGALAGVRDLILLKSNADYGALLIEMKTQKGRQSEQQKRWEELITQDCYKYVVSRSVDDFVREVEGYLDNS